MYLRGVRMAIAAVIVVASMLPALSSRVVDAANMTMAASAGRHLRPMASC